MPASTTVTGMVLSAMPVGEYDKRLVILTKEYGKISAFAKGARRPNSALLACSQPFTFGEFSLYTGRSSYTVSSAEVSNYFAELRETIDTVYYGLYFCEFVAYYTKENNDEKEVLKLLYQTLRVMTKKTIELPLIRAIFELKMMALSGEAPQVFHCLKCQKHNHNLMQKSEQSEEDYWFSAISGGLLCRNCRSHDYTAIKLSTSTVYTLQYIISKEVERLYTFRLSAEVLSELIRCVDQYLKCYVEYKFKSLDLIQIL